MAKKNHKYTHSHIEHHSDGSHTSHHVHEDGPHKDSKYASGSHDEMLDGMMDHTSAPNPGEGMDEANAPMAAAGAAPGIPGGAPQAA